jgi:acyltransferase
LDDTGLNNTGLNDTGLNDTGLNDTGLNNTGLDNTGLNDTGLNDTGLNDTGLDNTGLNDQRMARIAWLDQAKAYGIALVFYGHIVEQLATQGSAAALTQNTLIYAFHIPLFFLVSGYLGRNTALNGYRRSLSRLVPFVAFNLISLLVLVLLDGASDRGLQPGYYLFGLLSLVRGYPQFNPPTWFLVCLFTVETLDWAVQRLMGPGLWRRWGVALCLYGVGVGLHQKATFFMNATGISPQFCFFNHALIAYLFYALGQVLRQIPWGKIGLKLPAPRLAALALCAVVLLGTFNRNTEITSIGGLQLGNPVLLAITGFAGAIATLLLAQLLPIPQGAIARGLDWIGRNTLILLGMNGLLLRPYEAISAAIVHHIPDTALMVGLVCSAGTLASITLSVPVVWTLNRWLPQLFGHPKQKGPILPNLL